MAIYTYAANRRRDDFTSALRLDDGSTLLLGGNADIGADDFAQLDPIVVLLPGVVEISTADFPFRLEEPGIIQGESFEQRLAGVEGQLTTVESNSPSAGQKAALAGTNGTPGASNRYVTASDPALSGSGLPRTFRTVTTNDTATAGDFILADASGGAFTETLPPAPAVGALVTVKKTDASANAVAVAGTIEGNAAGYTITDQLTGATFEHVGANAWTIAAPAFIPSNGTNGTNGTPGTPGTNGTNGTDGILSSFQDEGVAVTARATLDIQGAGLSLTQNGSKLILASDVSQAYVDRVTRKAWRPTVVIAETWSVRGGSTLANTGALTSGQPTLVGGCILPAGVPVNNITFLCASTAVGAPTNQWFFLADVSRTVLAVTADDLTAAWAISATKTLALAATYIPSVDTPVYAGVVVAATTVPTLGGMGSPLNVANTLGLAPIFAGKSTTTGLTTPVAIGTVLGAIVAGNPPYAYIS